VVVAQNYEVVTPISTGQKDGTATNCIGSVTQLYEEYKKARRDGRSTVVIAI